MCVCIINNVIKNIGDSIIVVGAPYDDNKADSDAGLTRVYELQLTGQPSEQPTR